MQSPHPGHTLRHAAGKRGGGLGGVHEELAEERCIAVNFGSAPQRQRRRLAAKDLAAAKESKADQRCTTNRLKVDRAITAEDCGGKQEVTGSRGRYTEFLRKHKKYIYMFRYVYVY